MSTKQTICKSLRRHFCSSHPAYVDLYNSWNVYRFTMPRLIGTCDSYLGYMSLGYKDLPKEDRNFLSITLAKQIDDYGKSIAKT